MAGLHLVQGGRWQLVHDLERRAIAEQQEALKRRPNDEWFRQCLRNELEVLGTALAELKRFDESESAYNRALELTKGLVKQQPQRRLYRQQVANIYGNRAWMRTTRKQFEAAEGDILLSIKERRRLVLDFPRVAWYRQQLVGGLEVLGKAVLGSGRAAEAVRIFCEAVERSQQLAADHPQEKSYRQSVLALGDQLHHALRSIRDQREAIESYRHALATVGHLWERRYPEVVKGRYQSASWRLLLAIELQNAGRLVESEQQHLRAQDLLIELSKLEPDEVSYRHDIAGSIYHLAGISDLQGQTAQSARLYQKAARLYGELEKAKPKEPTYRWARGLCFQKRAIQLRRLGRPETEDVWMAAADPQRKLIEDFGPKPEYRQELGKALYELGRFLDETNRTEEAVKKYREAQAIQDGLVKDQPKESQHAKDLADTHTGLGVLFSNVLHQHEKAVAEFRKGLALRQKVWEANRKNRDEQSSLANSWMNLGGTYLDAGNFPESEKAYSSALKIQKPLAEGGEAGPADRQQLGWILKGLADVYVQTKRLEKSEETCLQALQICQGLVVAHPGRIPYAVDLAQTQLSVARICERLNKSQAALEWYGQAIKRAREILVVEPRHAAAGHYLHGGSLARATLLGALGRHAEALADWDVVVETAPAARRDLMVTERLWSLARAGDHARATKESGSIASRKNAGLGILVQSARIHSFCSDLAHKDGRLSAAEQKRLRQQYLDRALELIKRLPAGFFGDPENVKMARRDPALEPLRALPEFIKLIGEAEKR